MTDEVFDRMKSRTAALLAEAVDRLPAAPQVVHLQDDTEPLDTYLDLNPRYLNVDKVDLSDMEGLVGDDPQEVVHLLGAVAQKQTDQAKAKTPTEGTSTSPLIGAAALPQVTIKASEPNVLSDAARVSLVAFARRLCVGALIAGSVVAVLPFVTAIVRPAGSGSAVDLSSAGLAAGGLCLISLTALVIAYFTVMGFKNVEYGTSASGTQQPEADADDKPDKAPQPADAKPDAKAPIDGAAR